MSRFMSGEDIYWSQIAEHVATLKPSRVFRVLEAPILGGTRRSGTLALLSEPSDLSAWDAFIYHPDRGVPLRALLNCVAFGEDFSDFLGHRRFNITITHANGPPNSNGDTPHRTVQYEVYKELPAADGMVFTVARLPVNIGAKI